MLSESQPISALLTHAYAISIANDQDMQRKWIDVYGKFCGYGSDAIMRTQADYRLDMVLRAMEIEAVSAFGKPVANNPLMFAFDVQAALSRCWLLSTYESLRVTKNTEKGKADTKLRELFWRFSLVRIPIAKLEIARDNKIKEDLVFSIMEDAGAEPSERYSEIRQKDYHPAMSAETATGSVAWHVYDRQTKSAYWISRRMLSDAFLNFFDS